MSFEGVEAAPVLLGVEAAPVLRGVDEVPVLRGVKATPVFRGVEAVLVLSGVELERVGGGGSIELLQPESAVMLEASIPLCVSMVCISDSSHATSAACSAFILSTDQPPLQCGVL
jgi:hypothetical protein